jgi:magnesium-transporting ATPase (P-type)
VKNLLIRGSVLRNTDWAVGLAVYAGIDTKIFRNSKAPPHKISNVMKQMNRMLVQIFILQLAIVFISTGLNYYWSYYNLLKHPESGATQ